MYGDSFRACREKSGLSDAELVARMRKAGHSITLSRYRRIERNLAEPFVDDLFALHRLLPASITELVGEAETTPPT